MAFDLDNFSAKDLDSLIKQANQRKTALTRRTPAAQVRKKLTAMAKAEGYSIAELFGGRGAAKAAKASKTAGRKGAKARKTGKVAPKYRNPANARDTWTGRGLPPRWMAELIKKGKKREDFLIKR
jgi:DNA-binding protein H-NS